MDKMSYRRVAAISCAVMIVFLLAGVVFAQTPWTKIDKLLVKDEGYVLGTLQVDGATTLGGNVDLNGSDLIIDTDADSILDENTDDAIRMTLGAATGKFSVLTGNLAVGNGSPSMQLNGEDAYVEGRIEVDGQGRFDGAVGFNSTITTTLTNAAGGSANPIDYTATAGIMNGNDDLTVIDINLTNANHTGSSNTVQAIDVAGITGDAQATETAVNIGTGWDNGIVNASAMDQQASLTDSAAGIAGALTFDDTHINLTGSLFDSGGNLVLGDTVQITSTLDALGAIADSGGDLELADNVSVTGYLYDPAVGIAGALQLNDTHIDITGSLFDSGGNLVIGDSAQFTSTVDILGNVQDSGGDFTFADNVDLTTGHLTDSGAGIAGALELHDDHVDVTGSLFDSGGDLVLGDTVQITSTVDALSAIADSGGDLELADNVSVTGYLYDPVVGIAGALQLNDTHVDVTGSLFDSGGNLVLGDTVQITSTLDVLGNVQDSGGDFTIADNLDVTTGHITDSGAGIAGALELHDDHVDVTGSLFDSGGDLVLGDAAQVTSTLDVLGAISDSGGNLELADDVDLAGGYGGTGCSVTNATGNLTCNGTIYGDSTVTAVAGVTSGADVTISPDATGGNAGARNELSGLIRNALRGLGTGTNPGGATVALTDDTPSGEWVAIDAHTTASDDGTYYKVGTKSLGIAMGASAVATDGVHWDTSGAAPDWTGNESVGGWFYCDKVLAAGDLMFGITDDLAGETLVQVPAVATANKWIWREIDISGVAAASKDHIHDLSIELSAAGAAKVTFACYVDALYKWDATDEDSLGVNPIQDGVLSVVNTTTAVNLVEYTDYFVHWETGNALLVYITDQSTATVLASVMH